MRDLPQLLSNRGVDRGMVVAMEIDPDGRIGIQVFSAMNILQQGSLPSTDHDGLAPEPIAHLCERMPNVPVIELSDAMHDVKVRTRMVGAANPTAAGPSPRSKYPQVCEPRSQ